jgi:chromate transporter
MITPGPVVITVAFIGHLVAGPLGATAAALGVFLPCYFFVVIPAPYFKRFANDPRLRAFVDGVTATATGAIAGARLCSGKGPSSMCRQRRSPSRHFSSCEKQSGFQNRF